jgi:hypothetical protein
MSEWNDALDALKALPHGSPGHVCDPTPSGYGDDGEMAASPVGDPTPHEECVTCRATGYYNCSIHKRAAGDVSGEPPDDLTPVWDVAEAGRKELAAERTARETAERERDEWRDLAQHPMPESVLAEEREKREAAEARTATLEEALRDLLERVDSGERKIAPWRWIDHSCAECVPHSEILKAGFQCAYHRGRALTTPGTPAPKEPQ